jgi:Dolichyl-phosphate-mannose-protein mannosyltransferase
MNGVFIYDLFRTGNIFHPLDFARWYFAHFPALSMPYHPPLFPAYEAILFAIFDPKFGVGRLAVAITVSLSVYLLYRLVLINSGSIMIAVAVCGSFLFLGTSMYLEEDIMLEFPALVFVIAAMLSLQKLNKEGFSVSQGVSFALWVAAGIWTKQTVFVALTPFLYFLLMRSWKPFTRPGIWVSTAVSAVSALLLIAISASVGLSGTPHNWAPMSLSQAIVHNAFYYLQAVPVSMVILLIVIGVAASAISFRSGKQESPASWTYLYVAWAVSALTVVLMVPAYDPRYLFFTFAPVLALACESLYRLLKMALSPVNSAALIAAVALIFCGSHALVTPIWLTGPEVAARRVGGAGVKSTIYLGNSNGAFTFAMRLDHPDLKPVIFRGDKIFQGAVSRERLEEFAHAYGADAIAIESPRGEDLDWRLILRDSKSLKFWFQQEIESSLSHMRASLFVFRVSDSSSTPKRSIRERIETLGREETLPLADR